MITSGLFATVIVAALIVVSVSPFILLGLWLADVRKGNLW